MEITSNTILNFGKHKGKKANSVPASYLLWCNKNVSFFLLQDDYLIEVEKRSRKEAIDRMKENNKNYQISYDGVRYEDDIDFWTRVSPEATFDRIKQYDIEVPIDKWRKLCDIVRRNQ